MPWPPFVDHALSSRLEATEAAQLEAIARTAAAKLPARSIACAAIAGGHAAFLGPSMPVSRASGLGMRGPVSVGEVEALEDFFRTRGMGVRTYVSPFVHPTLFEHLGARGFRLDGLYAMLVRVIVPGEEIPAPSLTVRRARSDEAEAWVRTSLEAFFAPEPPSPEHAEIFTAVFDAPGSTYFFAEANGAFVGTAAVQVHEGAAYLFAGSTLPAHRGRGVQGALVRARIAFARDAGCDLAFSGAATASASQRNLERAGFSAVYSQALMVKSFG